MSILSKEEKTGIVKSRIKGLEYKKYGFEVDALVENAKVSPDAEALVKINDALEEIAQQLSVLNSELTTVNESEE